jgi:hypothetical protein
MRTSFPILDCDQIADVPVCVCQKQKSDIVMQTRAFGADVNRQVELADMVFGTANIRLEAEYD